MAAGPALAQTSGNWTGFYGGAQIGYADIDNLGGDNGWFIGAGYEHIEAPNISVGGELLYQELDNFNPTGVGVDATTLQVRVAYRF